MQKHYNKTDFRRRARYFIDDIRKETAKNAGIQIVLDRLKKNNRCDNY